MERIPTVSFDGTHRQDAMQSRKQAVDTDSVKPSSNDPLTENKVLSKCHCNHIKVRNAI